MCHIYNPIDEEATGNNLVSSFSLERNSEPRLWFLQRSKWRMQRSTLS